MGEDEPEERKNLILRHVRNTDLTTWNTRETIPGLTKKGERNGEESGFRIKTGEDI